MMTLTRISGALALTCMLPAAAQQMSVSDPAPGLPVWEAGLVGGAVSGPAYPGADARSSRVLALPFLVYRGKVLRSDASGIGARLLRSERYEVDVGFAASLPARSDAGAARAGMPDLGFLGEFGPRVKILLANPTPTSRLRLDLPLRAVMEFRGGVRRRGATFEPRLTYATRDIGSAWSMDASVGLVVGDGAINRYFYAVAPQYASAARPAYQARPGLMLVRAGLSASYKVNDDVRLFGYVRGDSHAGAANRDSPLMRKNHGGSIGGGFAWTLGRSGALAAD